MRFIYTLLLVMVVSLATPLSAVAVAPPATNNPTSSVAAAKAEHAAKLAAMTPAERRSFKRAQRQEVKAAIKAHKQAKKSGQAVSDDQLLIIIITILLPPLGVALYEGDITTKFWISLLLTLLFYIPGLIYSLLVVTGNAKKK